MFMIIVGDDNVIYIDNNAINKLPSVLTNKELSTIDCWKPSSMSTWEKLENHWCMACFKS